MASTGPASLEEPLTQSGQYFAMAGIKMDRIARKSTALRSLKKSVNQALIPNNLGPLLNLLSEQTKYFINFRIVLSKSFPSHDCPKCIDHSSIESVLHADGLAHILFESLNKFLDLVLDDGLH